MRLPHRILLLLVFIARSGAAESIEWQDIGEKVSILGKLGIPLGTVTEIEATIVGLEEFSQPLPLPPLSGTYFLKVESVGGRTLAVRPISFFHSWAEDDAGQEPLPNNLVALYRSKTGDKDPVVKTAHAKPFEKDFLGKRYRLLVYETAEFKAYPLKGEPKDAPFVQYLPDPTAPPGSRLRTAIYVMKILELKK